MITKDQALTLGYDRDSWMGNKDSSNDTWSYREPI